MRKAVHLCLSFAVAVFLSIYLLSKTAMLICAAGFGLLAFSSYFFHNQNRLRVLLLCIGAGVGFFWCWFRTALCPELTLQGLTSVQEALCQACQKAFPEDVSSFFEALLTGDKTSLYADGDHYYLLRTAGLAHVVAISGMHISFITAFYLSIAGYRRGAVLGAFPLLLFFAAMTGFSPSVCRAALMQILCLMAPLLRRENDGPTTLSVVLAFLLLLKPQDATSVSLQLSFASVAGIYWLTPILQERLPSMLAVSLGAMVFTLPLGALHFGTFSLMSPLTNLLCLWMISTLYIGGFLIVLLSLLLPGIAAFLGSMLAWGVRYIYLVCKIICRIPFGQFSVSNQVYGFWLLAIYIIIFCLWLYARSGRTIKLLIPCAFAVGSLLVCILAVSLHNLNKVSVTAVDVGQGACSVIEAGGRTVVVDCGGDVQCSQQAEDYLISQNRYSIDAMVLTHLHQDHASGAADIVRHMRPKQVYMPVLDVKEELFQEILQAAQEVKAEIFMVYEDTSIQYAKLTMTLFAPDYNSQDNENCLILLASSEDFDILITGDTPAKLEKQLVQENSLPDGEVLLVGHHGSSSATSEELLEAFQPETAIISVGENSYGHPTAQTLYRLISRKISVMRTDLDGTVTVCKD